MKNRGTENQSEGLGRRIEGKIDEVVGAATGDLSQEMGGKLKKNLGKVQQKVGEEQTEAEIEANRRNRRID
jgi:uncharacterized protein YjbJ (UPF0337 family)